MAARRVRRDEDLEEPRKRPPATTPHVREQELIGMSIDLAEQQIRSGTASSQVITHFLKLGSSDTMLAQRKAEEEIEYLAAKREALSSAHRMEELIDEAITAMRSYAGQEPLSNDD